jgi:hypothetical protein
MAALSETVIAAAELSCASNSCLERFMKGYEVFEEKSLRLGRPTPTALGPLRPSLLLRAALRLLGVIRKTAEAGISRRLEKL